MTGGRRCGLAAAAGDGGGPGPGQGPGSGTGLGLCQDERKLQERTEPVPQEPERWDNVGAAYLQKDQENEKMRMEKPNKRIKEEGGPTGFWSGVFFRSWYWLWFCAPGHVGAVLMEADSPPPADHMTPGG